MTGLWDDLVAALDAWGTVRGVGEGRIELTTPGDRRVTVVLTPGQYDEMTSIMGLSGADGADHVIDVVRRLGARERFAVYGDYRLEPSETDTLPRVVDGLPTGGGSWTARDRHGREVRLPRLPPTRR